MTASGVFVFCMNIVDQNKLSYGYLRIILLQVAAERYLSPN